MPILDPQFVDGILQTFQVSDSELVGITEKFIEAFKLGIEANQGLAIAPSFVKHIPNGTENGTFLTLDFEVNAFRVAQVTLDGKRNFSIRQKIINLSNEIKGGEASEFFDFVAESVKGFLIEYKLRDNSNEAIPLGLTFGFPLEKTSIRDAKLVALTKGYMLKNAVGNNVFTLLQDALDRKELLVKCTAVVNDTVATFLSQSYKSGNCVLAATFGIGTNGAFPEQIVKVNKLKSLLVDSSSEMILNTEWGAFDNERAILPHTPFDNKLHRESLRPGFQSFEKMVSWMYLGEIARNVITSFIDNSPPILFRGTSTPIMNTQFGFDSYYLTLIDRAATLADIKKVLVENLGFRPEDISDADLDIVRKVSKTVTTRSARLAACAVAAALVYCGYVTISRDISGNGERLPVAVNGELILMYPEFEDRLRAGLIALIGKDAEVRVEFKNVGDGAALGAALSAFEASLV